MENITQRTEVFADLPDAMVQELLRCTESLVGKVQHQVDKLRSLRDELRNKAEKAGIVKKKADLDVPREPTVAGVDGSYQLHRLTALDLCAVAAVAVEGTVRETQHHWQEPHFLVWTEAAPHRGQPSNILRGLMTSFEMELAVNAPHDVVLLDGSFASLIISVNQGVNQLAQVSPNLAYELGKRWKHGTIFRNITQVLSSKRIVAVPKFTSHNELSQLLGLHTLNTDGKTLATLILEADEYTHPMSMSHPTSNYHLPDPADKDELNKHMHALKVVYYRPYTWSPAVRLELPETIANSLTHLARILEGIKRQYFTPAVLEPYPLFLADRMVKGLGAGVQVLEQAIAQQVAGDSVDVETTLLFLQNYRTEGGRGGTE